MDDSDNAEQVMNRFAAELLMPKEHFIKFLTGRFIAKRRFDKDITVYSRKQALETVSDLSRSVSRKLGHKKAEENSAYSL